jgi:hypothetical protein
VTQVILCIACQYGDHDGHIPAVPAPAGMLGGHECPCKGDCAGNGDAYAPIDAILNAPVDLRPLFRL